MSKQSDRVKKWRKNCKERIIEAMGGKCCLCGYNKCSTSLALHHLDPSKKDIGFGAIRANPTNWNNIVKELRKCVLVCHNCHGEIHTTISFVPRNAPKFNEDFVDYRKLEGKEYFEPCPICEQPKRKELITCSKECAAKNRYKVDWTSINLIDELKTKTIVALAEELGCSDGAIHKRLRKLGLK